jgi:hypothetical protein
MLPAFQRIFVCMSNERESLLGCEPSTLKSNTGYSLRASAMRYRRWTASAFAVVVVGAHIVTHIRDVLAAGAARTFKKSRLCARIPKKITFERERKRERVL